MQQRQQLLLIAKGALFFLFQGLQRAAQRLGMGRVCQEADDDGDDSAHVNAFP